LSDQRALVTGASSGIGAAFARELAARGWSLTLVARDRARLEALASELPPGRSGVHAVLVADLARPEGVRVAGLACAEQELVVNCAGVLLPGKLVDCDPEQLESANFLMTASLFGLTRAALRGMEERGRGTVINVASRAAYVPEPGLAVYCATKASVRAFTLAVARELEGSGVHVHLSCPGNTATELHDRAGLVSTREQVAARTSAEQVVRETLAAVERGALVSVPGEPRWHTRLSRLFGGRALAKVAGVLTRLARA
jgi:short-subunit dehydrogenase